MSRIFVVLGAVAAIALPSLAQAQTAPSRSFNERITNPLRNTPAGHEPTQPAGGQYMKAGPETEACKLKLEEAAFTVNNWQASMRKTNALKELESARMAVRGADARTCRMHVQAALSEDSK